MPFLWEDNYWGYFRDKTLMSPAFILRWNANAGAVVCSWFKINGAGVAIIRDYVFQILYPLHVCMHTYIHTCRSFEASCLKNHPRLITSMHLRQSSQVFSIWITSYCRVECKEKRNCSWMNGLHDDMSEYYCLYFPLI